MKLITPEFEELMKDYSLYSQEKEDDPLVVSKFFNPVGAGTWYLTEYNPEDHLAFGYVTGLGSPRSRPGGGNDTRQPERRGGGPAAGTAK